MKITFLGINNLYIHKRGVENVIHFQSKAAPLIINYYINWDTITKVYKYENLICIGIKKDLFWPIKLNIILKKINKRDKQIFIHSHNPLMSIVSRYQSNLFTVHDALYYLTKSTKHRLNKLFWLLEKLLYLRCNYVHFISDFAKKMSLHNCKTNFIIISNTSHFENSKSNPFVIDCNLKKYTKEVIKVFIIRSIEERAKIDLIIEVAERLKKENFEFLIAGKGPLLIDYRNKISNLGLKNITLLGYVSDSDLINYYNECDLVLVTASYGEGFGLPIIEGYLFNKPVVASNVCAIPEIIISNNFLFENTIQSLIDRLYFALKLKNIDYRGYYDQCFSNEKIVLSMNKLYKSLL
jgi:glycosyltransferase involved in cell wall biosynthesis